MTKGGSGNTLNCLNSFLFVCVHLCVGQTQFSERNACIACCSDIIFLLVCDECLAVHRASTLTYSSMWWMWFWHQCGLDLPSPTYYLLMWFLPMMLCLFLWTTLHGTTWHGQELPTGFRVLSVQTLGNSLLAICQLSRNTWWSTDEKPPW